MTPSPADGPTDGPVDRTRAARDLRRSVGALATAASTRMEEDVSWFRELSAQERSWVQQILQAGIRGFVDWFPAQETSPTETAIAATVFGAAPRALTGVITLRQTVDLVRLCIETVEHNLESVVAADDVPEVRDAVLRYGREIAFATAEVYARAAGLGGAWDARLEALVVDAILRAEPDQAVLSRAAALGWDDAHEGVAVVLGDLPAGGAGSDHFEEVRRQARAQGHPALCGAYGDRLVVVLGALDDPVAAADCLEHGFGPGPIVVGPRVAGLAQAHQSSRAAMSAHRAVAGWPEAPRPVASADLLPERALAGDGHARRHLVDEVYVPLRDARGDLLLTLAAYLGTGGTIEATARALIVHANTVRYRLNQVHELTGLSPSDPRDAFALHIAVVLGRQRDD